MKYSFWQLSVKHIAAALISCSLFFSFTKAPEENSKIAERLQLIPPEDKHFLEAFFRSLISFHDGCYVLFGDKPAALMIYQEETALTEANFVRYLESFIPEKKGYNTWKKYQSQFPLKDYAIVKAKASTANHLAVVFLVQKKRLLKALRQNFNLFNKAFPQHISPEALCDAMLKDPSILGKICFEHELLLGIILGFGKDNATLFERQSEIISYFSRRVHKGEKSYNSLMRPIPSLGFKTLEEELEAIAKKEGSIIIPKDGPGVQCLHLPLGYLVDTTKTNLKHLRQKYKRQRVEATKAYQRGNFLEVTLKALAKEAG